MLITAVGIVFTTIFLLAVALAWYDLLLYCFLTLKVLIPQETLTKPIDLSGQVVFAVFLTLIAIGLVWSFSEFEKEEKVPEGEHRGLSDRADVTSSLLGASSLGVSQVGPGSLIG